MRVSKLRSNRFRPLRPSDIEIIRYEIWNNYEILEEIKDKITKMNKQQETIKGDLIWKGTK